MFFAGFGCISAIGITAEMTMSSICAGVSGYNESNFQCNNNALAIMATVPDDLFLTFAIDTDYLGGYTTKMDRASKMMLYALNDLQEQTDLDTKVPFIWVQEEPHSSREPVPLDFIKDQLQYYEAPIDFNHFNLVAMGRAGGIAALDRAHQLLHQAGHDYVLIGGTECPLHTPWLESLDKRKRLKRNDSKDAFAPGEGAAFLLLSRTPELALCGNDQTIQIFSPGISESKAHWYNHAPNTAEALHLAMSKAISHYRKDTANKEIKFDHVISSMNGENFWAKEYGVAITRLNDQFTEEHTIKHPFEYTGDLGAISGVFLIGYAADLLASGKSARSIVYASSDNEWRSAVCVEIR